MADWRLFFVTKDGQSPESDFPAHKRGHDNLEDAKAEGDRVLQQLRERGDPSPWVANIQHNPVDVGAPEPDWSTWMRCLNRGGWHRR